MLFLQCITACSQSFTEENPFIRGKGLCMCFHWHNLLLLKRGHRHIAPKERRFVQRISPGIISSIINVCCGCGGRSVIIYFYTFFEGIGE